MASVRLVRQRFVGSGCIEKLAVVHAVDLPSSAHRVPFRQQKALRHLCLTVNVKISVEINKRHYFGNTSWKKKKEVQEYLWDMLTLDLQRNYTIRRLPTKSDLTQDMSTIVFIETWLVELYIKSFEVPDES